MVGFRIPLLVAPAVDPTDTSPLLPNLLMAVVESDLSCMEYNSRPRGEHFITVGIGDSKGVIAKDMGVKR